MGGPRPHAARRRRSLAAPGLRALRGASPRHRPLLRRSRGPALGAGISRTGREPDADRTSLLLSAPAPWPPRRGSALRDPAGGGWLPGHQRRRPRLGHATVLRLLERRGDVERAVGQAAGDAARPARPGRTRFRGDLRRTVLALRPAPAPPAHAGRDRDREPAGRAAD